MASETILKELFQVAKGSSSFSGMADDEVWKACQSYSDRTDDDIKIAISNIQKKDQAMENKSEEQQKKLEQSKEKIIKLHEQEASDRQKDEQNAERMLKKLFNL